MSTAAADLPDDVLAEVLRRLPARSLAASLCVCKAWRAVVDEQQLLVRLRRILPDFVRGLFINYQDHHRPHFFSRRAAVGPQIVGRFDFVEPENMRRRWSTMLNHCNGLVLCCNYHGSSFFVCNPITRQWKLLPHRADNLQWERHSNFLVFDPAVSKQYKVLLVPREPEMTLSQRHSRGHGIEPSCEEDRQWLSMEWPPTELRCHVFSSTTGRWKETVFVREGEAAGPAALLMECMVYSVEKKWRYSVYWKGTLYIHCHGEYIIRLSLSDCTYRVIKSPIDRAQCFSELRTRSFIGRSQNGVTFAAIDETCQLQVWTLNKSQDGTEEWVLKHESILKPHLWNRPGEFHRVEYDGPWVLDEFLKVWKTNNKAHHWSSDEDDENEADDYSSDDDEDGSTDNEAEELNSDDDDDENGNRDSEEAEEFSSFDDHQHENTDNEPQEWSSDDDDDNVVDVPDWKANKKENCTEIVEFLGFHPYKEVIFLCSQLSTAVAYHLDTPKVQYLGIIEPSDHNYGVTDSFVYTPCAVE